MVIRTKSGEFRVGDKSALLEFLGVKKNDTGVQKLSGDVELITSVPFKVEGIREKGKEGDMQKTELTTDNIDNCFSWTFSTFDLDRFHERIDPAGWDFKRFMENPVVEWAHRYDIPAIGRAENVFVDENGLHGVIVFNDKKYDPFGWSIGQRVRAGVIRAGSVGFRVMEIEIPSKEESKDGTSLIFRKQELLEFSICNVPANPFALAKGMSNEQLAMSNERSVNASPFWNCLINKL